MSRIKRKPAFCICENKGADQLCGKRTAEQHLYFIYIYTIMILYFQTHGSGQTVQTLEEQSDQRLHCLLFHLHLFDEIPKGLASFLEF